MLRHVILRRLLLLFMLLGMAGGATYGQILLQMIPDSLNGVPSPDTVLYGDTTAYNFSIVNNSPVNFSDSLFIHLRTTQGSFVIAAFDSIVIPASGSLSFHVIDTIQQLRYGGGVSIIVIWPTATTPILTDSIKDTIFVGIAEVVNGEVNDFDLRVFPNPAQDALYLRAGPAMEHVRETQLVDLFGRVIQQHAGLPQQLDLEHLPAGLYFLRVKLETGPIAVLRIVKR